MAVYKNKAAQKIACFAYDSTDGSAKTGDAANITAQISIDGAATAATNDVNPTELDATDAPGIYLFDATQAETNGDLLIVAPVSSTTDILIEPLIIYTEPETRSANATQIGSQNVGLSSDNRLRVDVAEWNDIPLATTNPLPNAAPNAANGLPISVAGGLDMDAMFRNTAYGEGYVWFEPDTANSGTTTYVNGTISNPASTLNDAFTIAAALNSVKLPTVKIKPGSQEGYTPSESVALPVYATLDLNGTYLDFGNYITLGGVSANIFSSVPGASIVHHATRVEITSGTYVYNLAFNGTAGLTLRHGAKIGHCVFTQAEGSIKVSPTVAAVPVHLYACPFQKDGQVIDFADAADGCTLLLDDCWGHVEIQNLTGTQVVKYLGWGKATLNANCDGGELVYDSHIIIVDNSDGAVTQTPWSSGPSEESIADLASDLAAVKDVTDILDSAQGEPTGVPPVDPTPIVKLSWLYRVLRNRISVTSSFKTFYDNDDTADFKKALSDDGTTYTEDTSESA